MLYDLLYNSLTQRNVRPNKVNATIGTNIVGIMYKNKSQAGWANQLKQRSSRTTVNDKMAIVNNVLNHIKTIKLEHFKHDLK